MACFPDPSAVGAEAKVAKTADELLGMRVGSGHKAKFIKKFILPRRLRTLPRSWRGAVLSSQGPMLSSHGTFACSETLALQAHVERHVAKSCAEGRDVRAQLDRYAASW